MPLKRQAFILFIFLFNLNLFGQEYKRLDNEKAEDFAKRIKPNEKGLVCELTGKVVETKLWDNKTTVIIACYNCIKEIREHDTLGNAVAYVFIPVKNNIYKKVLIDDMLEYLSSGDKIESIFFANADKDEENELIFLISGSVSVDNSSDCECSGIYYHTQFYDNFDFKKSPNQLTHLWKISSEFEGLEGIRLESGEKVTAEYKTASAVKKRLKAIRHQLGYDFSYPIIKKSGETMNDFIPEGWILLDSASGDLNKDQTVDLAIVIQHNDSVNFVEVGVRDADTIKTQPRVLVILFKEKSKASYTLAEQSNTFILNHDNPNMDDPYTNININKGVLDINFNFWSSIGSWSTSNSSYKFRFQNNEFYLIGLDYYSHGRNTEDFEHESYNYLTKKMSITRTHSDEEPKVEWQKIEGQLQTLKSFKQEK